MCVCEIHDIPVDSIRARRSSPPGRARSACRSPRPSVTARKLIAVTQVVAGTSSRGRRRAGRGGTPRVPITPSSGRTRSTSASAPPTHEDQLGRLRAPLRARDRRVDHRDAGALSDAAGLLPREPGLRRRRVEQQRAGPEARAAVRRRRRPERLHDRAVRHHRDDDVAASGEFGRRARDAARRRSVAATPSALAGTRRRTAPSDGRPATGAMPSAAHHAETDEAERRWTRCHGVQGL